jgi:hypothetical protein
LTVAAAAALDTGFISATLDGEDLRAMIYLSCPVGRSGLEF